MELPRHAGSAGRTVDTKATWPLGWGWGVGGMPVCSGACAALSVCALVSPASSYIWSCTEVKVSKVSMATSPSVGHIQKGLTRNVTIILHFKVELHNARCKTVQISCCWTLKSCSFLPPSVRMMVYKGRSSTSWVEKNKEGIFLAAVKCKVTLVWCWRGKKQACDWLAAPEGNYLNFS